MYFTLILENESGEQVNLSATAKSMPPILVRFLTTGGCGHI